MSDWPPSAISRITGLSPWARHVEDHNAERDLMQEVVARLGDGLLTGGYSALDERLANLAERLAALEGGEEPVAPVIGNAASATIASGSTATLTWPVTDGTLPITVHIYEGTAPTTTTEVATVTLPTLGNATYTSAALTGPATKNYWARATNSAGSDDSTTATITVSSPGTAGAGSVVLVGGGFSNYIAQNPANPSEVMRATDTGGPSYSADGGRTWLALTDGFFSNAQGNTAAVCWLSNGTVLTGTGRFSGDEDTPGSYDCGLWKRSAPLTGPWSRKSSNILFAAQSGGSAPPPGANHEQNRTAQELIVEDTGRSGYVYASGYKNGLFRSSNYGDTWTTSAIWGDGKYIRCLLVVAADTLLVGTMRDGMWRISSANGTPVPTKLTGGDLLAMSSVDSIRKDGADKVLIGIHVDGTGKPGGVYHVTGYETGATVTCTDRSGSGGTSIPKSDVNWHIKDLKISGTGASRLVMCGAISGSGGSKALLWCTNIDAATPVWKSAFTDAPAGGAGTVNFNVGGPAGPLWYMRSNDAQPPDGRHSASGVVINGNTIITSGKNGGYFTTDKGVNWYPSVLGQGGVICSAVSVGTSSDIYTACSDWGALMCGSLGATEWKFQADLPADGEGIFTSWSTKTKGTGNTVVACDPTVWETSSVAGPWTTMGNPGAAAQAVCQFKNAAGTKVTLASCHDAGDAAKRGIYKKVGTAAWALVSGTSGASGPVGTSPQHQHFVTNYEGDVLYYNHTTGLWRSIDYGDSWQRIDNAGSVDVGAGTGRYPGGVCWHPTDDDVAIVATGNAAWILTGVGSKGASAVIGTGGADIARTVITPTGSNYLSRPCITVKSGTPVVYLPSMPTASGQSAKLYKSNIASIGTGSWTNVATAPYREWGTAVMDACAFPDGNNLAIAGDGSGIFLLPTP